jgi:hypothetical protein
MIGDAAERMSFAAIERARGQRQERDYHSARFLVGGMTIFACEFA